MLVTSHFETINPLDKIGECAIMTVYIAELKMMPKDGKANLMSPIVGVYYNYEKCYNFYKDFMTTNCLDVKCWENIGLDSVSIEGKLDGQFCEIRITQYQPQT